MRKQLQLIIGVLVIVFFSSSTYASYQCMVSINKVLIYANGFVNVNHSGRNDYTVICNLNEPRGGVGITTCAMWASMLQNIKRNNDQAHFYYSGDGDCSTLPTYGNSPAPVYIGDM
jgi:hypothetical protein